MTDQTIPEPVASFIDAVNRHDGEAFLAAFGEIGAVDDWGRVFTGPQEIEGWSEKEFIGADGTLDVEEVDVDGSTVSVVGDWRSTHANGRSRFTFETAGGTITRMTIREG